MASIIKSDNGVSSGVTGIVQTADSTGQLALQTTTSGGTATTAITIDNSQNVGVGVTPSTTTTGAKSFEVGKVGSGLISFSQTQFGLASNYAYVGTADTFAGTGYASVFQNVNGAWRWYTSTASGTAGNPTTLTNTMTLDLSGNLLIGTTTTGFSNSNSYFFNIGPGYGANAGINHVSGTASGVPYLAFAYNGTSIGSITQNGTTAVLYNTTSDYRLKSNVQPVTTGLSVINQLNPVNFTWISDNEADTGFLAHEFQAVIPRSVTGEKDATKTEEYEITPAVKDENGNVTTPAVMGTRTVPVYQQMDNSGAVPYLVAAIKELSAEVTALKAKIGV